MALKINCNKKAEDLVNSEKDHRINCKNNKANMKKAMCRFIEIPVQAPSRTDHLSDDLNSLH